MKKLLLFLFLITTASIFAQERTLLRGQVLYRNVNVVNQNVINTTAETATITNEDGAFEIMVAIGDQLAFTAVNYQLKTVIITQEILDKGRLVVEVKEKVTELDEVVVTPENQEAYIKLQEERFKEFYYEPDKSTGIRNVALSQQERFLENGINFVNIFKAIFKSKKKETVKKEPLKLSKMLRQVYDDEFFVVDLRIPQDKIDAFLYFCDNKLPEESLLKKDAEFMLIDFLVSQSKEFLKN